MNSMSRYCGWLLLLFLLGGCEGLPRIEQIGLVNEKANLAGGTVYNSIPASDCRLPDYERLSYDCKWLGLQIGTFTTSIKGIEKFKDRDVYVLEATMKTNAFFSKIYKIEDRFVSYLDVEKLYTLRHEVYRREGAYKKDVIIEFDQINHKAYFKNNIDSSKGSFDIPVGVQDVLSAYYFLTFLPIQLGDRVEFYVNNNEKNYRFFGLIKSKVLIRLPILSKKASEAFLLQPYATLDGKKVDKGIINAYFSSEKKRVLLFARLKGAIFTEISIYFTKKEN